MAETRKLAAILAADVVGYSRLTAADEDRTLARLRGLRSDLIDPAISVHHGRVVKRTGDGILIEFRSVVDAVRCAIEVQIGMVERNAGLPPERRIEFRIGVHLGDVVEESDGDLMGDGVNIAARLEGIAKPGAICLSEDAYRQVKSRLDLAVRDLGATQLKNIAEPVRVYSLEVSKQASAKSPGRAAPSAWMQVKSVRWAGVLLVVLVAAGILVWERMDRTGAPGVESKGLPVNVQTQSRGPALAVLPFDNISGDPKQDFFSDGVSEEIITVVSHYDDLRVLARNTTFTYKKKAVDIEELGRQLKVQYVIEGSVQQVADQLSVTAQLVDARSGTHVWAQTYERPTTSASLLSIRDDIAQRIGAAVGGLRSGAIAKAEVERTRNEPVADLTSYECVAHAYRAVATANVVEPMLRARACLEATVKRDPTYADAWAALATILAIQRFWGTGLASPDADDIDKRANLIPRVVETANRAVQLAPEGALAHLSLFYAYYLTCQPERMRVEADRVLAINPNDAGALGVMGNDLAYVGEWDYGRQLVEKGLALAGTAAPRWWWWGIAKDHYRKGEYSEALDNFRRAYTETSWLDHLHLVYTLPYLGKIDDARAEIPKLLKLNPQMSVHEADRVYKMLCFDADFRQRMVTALRLAGLREETVENSVP
jgi:class 3 adenylate cyclase/TolB-like protein